MDKLLVLLEAAHGIYFFLNEVLHSLHVVVRHLLDIFHPLGISWCKQTVDVAELIKK